MLYLAVTAATWSPIWVNQYTSSSLKLVTWHCTYPLKVPLDAHPIHGFFAHASLPPKRQFDLFVRFRMTHCRDQPNTNHATPSLAIGCIYAMCAMRSNYIHLQQGWSTRYLYWYVRLQYWYWYLTILATTLIYRPPILPPQWFYAVG